jgi:hypothetical protein
MVDEIVHVLARVLLRISSPVQTYRTLRRVGSVLPQRSSRAAVRGAAIRLSRRGTCLSRAMAIAARSPDVDIVIGLVPRNGAQRMLAHAWLELDGVPIDRGEVSGLEIARIPTMRTSVRRASRDDGNRR